jgi:hypothetical protein
MLLDMDAPHMGGPVFQGPMGGMMFPFFFFPFMFVFMAVWFVIALLLAIWVYKDAEIRGENGALWLILVLLTGWIGLIIWLIIRTGKPIKSLETSERTSHYSSKDVFCSSCGLKVSPNSLFCPNCGASIDQNWAEH